MARELVVTLPFSCKNTPLWQSFSIKNDGILEWFIPISLSEKRTKIYLNDDLQTAGRREGL